MATINLNIKDLLRDWQLSFFNNYKKYNVLVLHRRAWKTVLAVLFIIYRALAEKGTYWYLAPYRSQSKQIAWDILLKFINQIPWCKINISELQATLPNWSKITLFGADNQDALRWLDLKGVVFDEYAQMSPSIYPEIIFPMINAHDDWWAVWIWTPKGKNSFHSLYEKALQSDKYYTMYLTVEDTHLLSAEQISDAKEEMDESSFQQEMMLNWDVSIKGSFYWKELTKMREEWRIKNFLYDPALPVYTAWDLWISDKMIVLFFQYYDGSVRIIDEYENSWYWFPHYFDVLTQKGYNYQTHYVPHDISVKELSTGMTRLETFRKMFWWENVEVLKRQSVEDGINMVRQILPKTYFDAGLEAYINIISEYRPKFDEKTWVSWKPIHCDHSDALRYLAIAYSLFVQTEVEGFTFSTDYSEFI